MTGMDTDFIVLRHQTIFGIGTLAPGPYVATSLTITNAGRQEVERTLGSSSKHVFDLQRDGIEGRSLFRQRGRYFQCRRCG